MHFNVEITMKLTSRIIEYICCKQSLAVCTLPGIHCQLGADANNMKFRRDKRREPLGLLDHPPPLSGVVLSVFMPDLMQQLPLPHFILGLFSVSFSSLPNMSLLLHNSKFVVIFYPRRVFFVLL
jgi:hypothetical protein